MEIKINPKEESPKTLRALAQFLLRISENNKELPSRSSDNYLLGTKGAKTQNLFGENSSQREYPNEQNKAIPEGMFALFDTPTNLGNSSFDFNDAIKYKREKPHDSSIASNLIDEISSSTKEHSDEEKDEMVYDINEFFY